MATSSHSRKPSIASVLKYGILLLTTVAQYSNALYFHIYRNERKCFIEEMPEDTIFHGIYEVTVSTGGSHNFAETPPGFGMFVDVTNEQGKSLLSRSYGSKGKFSFTSDIPGEYLVCMGSNTTSSFNMLKDTRQRLRVHFKIKVGEHTTNYREIAQKDELTELELHVRKMIEQVGAISREQNYQRHRETKFRRTSEEINAWVMRWAFIQVTILMGLGFYQMRSLRKFFEAKKLV